RSKRDWSSDVCSSDLGFGIFDSVAIRQTDASGLASALRILALITRNSGGCGALHRNLLSRRELDLSWRNFWSRPDGSASSPIQASEERRVGKVRRSRC